MSALDWQADAVCASTDPEIFFPEKGKRDSATAARLICAGCPVQAECLQYALDNDMRWGIWGGVNERPRRALKGRAA